jgi:hypothetical protein
VSESITEMLNVFFILYTFIKAKKCHVGKNNAMLHLGSLQKTFGISETW